MCGSTDHFSLLSTLKTGIFGKCPVCETGSMFNGFLATAPRCTNCGLDFEFGDAGDGPAVFIIMIVGFVVVGLVLWTEFTYEPPVWVHIILFFPLTLILSLGLLRPLKGVLLVLQYRNRAVQAELINGDDTDE